MAFVFAQSGCSRTTPTNRSSAEGTSTKLTQVRHEHEHGEGVDKHESRRIQLTRPVLSKDSEGRSVERFGPILSIRKKETVASIIKNQSKLLGKPVHMEGFVSSMCRDRRRWIAIVDSKQSAVPMLVFTVPLFLVPRNALGKQVRVEGVVETLHVPAEKLRRMAKEHALPVPEQKTGMIERTIVRARSVEFF